MTYSILSRSQAKAAGQTTYFTGKQCGNGHISYRFVSNGGCSECLKLSNRRLYHSDLDASRERRRVYGKKNAQAARLRASQWAKENSGKVSAKVSARRALLLHRLPKWLTRAERDQIMLTYTFARAWSAATGVEHQVDHIIPLRGKNVCGLHVPWNLRIISAAENCRKGNRIDPSITLM